MITASALHTDRIDAEKVEKGRDTRSRSFEESMVATESYRQAMFNEMGLLYLDFAIDFIKSRPELSDKFTKQSIEFLTRKIKLVNKEEQDILEQLKDGYELLDKKQYDESDIERIKNGLKQLQIFINEEQNVVFAREKYYKTFKQY
jgi:hypothetical protein